MKPGTERHADDPGLTVVRLPAERADEPRTEAPGVAAGDDSLPAKEPRSRGSSFGDYARANTRTLAAVALLAAGIVFVLLGWYGAANTNILTEQIPYLISGGLLGVALIIVAGFMASSASLERQNRELREDLRNAIGSLGSSPRTPASGSFAAPALDGRVYVVKGGRSYHLSGCPIVEGKESSAFALDEARSSGYTACKLCGRD